MRLIILTFLLAITNIVFSQNTIPISNIDTLIPFFGKNSLRLYGYNNRVIPFDSKNPLHVTITYGETKKVNFEYFRVDSNTYMVYEYFRDGKASSNDGIKSRGNKVVKKKIIDSSITGVRHIGVREPYSTKEIHYFKEFTKEGEWEEYEDSIFEHKYWIGNYINDKRVGLWKHLLYWPVDDFLLEEINYDIDSAKKIYSINKIKTISIDSLEILLLGRWSLRTCESNKDFRISFAKCKKYDGHFGDDCNNKWAKENYYEFMPSNKFIRQRGEGCYKFKESCTSGTWKVLKKNDNLYIQIKYLNGQIWNLKVLYFDNDLNLITDRE